MLVPPIYVEVPRYVEEYGVQVFGPWHLWSAAQQILSQDDCPKLVVQIAGVSAAVGTGTTTTGVVVSA